MMNVTQETLLYCAVAIFRCFSDNIEALNPPQHNSWMHDVQVSLYRARNR